MDNDKRQYVDGMPLEENQHYYPGGSAILSKLFEQVVLSGQPKTASVLTIHGVFEVTAVRISSADKPVVG